MATHYDATISPEWPSVPLLQPGPMPEPRLRLDPAFADLLPPLDEDEREALEASLREYGMLEPVRHWFGTIIDGHTRYVMAQDLGIDVKQQAMMFRDMAEARRFVILQHIGRRNLNPYTRAALALTLQADVKETMRQDRANHVEGDRLDKRLADVANTGHDTIHKVRTVEEEGLEHVRRAARDNELSIRAAYQMTRALRDASPPVVDVVKRFELLDPGVVSTLALAEPEALEEIAMTGFVQPGEEEDAVSITAPANEVERAIQRNQQEKRRQAYIASHGERVATHVEATVEQITSTRVTLTVELPQAVVERLCLAGGAVLDIALPPELGA